MPRDCVIFDLDGTLADVRHRLHYVRATPPDWQAFFDACVDDAPYPFVVALAQMIDASRAGAPQIGAVGRDVTIFICTGRPARSLGETKDWLSRHWVPYDRLLTRQDGDHRPDDVVKAEMLARIRADGYEPLFAVDDRPSVVAMWRREGVPCLAMDDSEWAKEQHHLFGGPEK